MHPSGHEEEKQVSNHVEYYRYSKTRLQQTRL